MLRESFVFAFGLAAVLFCTLFCTVASPIVLQSTPNWALALSRLYWLALPMIVCLVFIVYFWVNVGKIDREKDDKLVASIKTAFKEAIKEDRDEQRKKDIYEDKY
jgi:uncharacterized BrkB/YihY/UPF0761 family membrane protein